MAEQDGKRVIEQQATSEVFADDWFLKDSVTEGTTKISSENLKAFINEDIDLSAEAVSYDNTSSGLEADNVQDAIDEVLETAGKVDDVKVDGESVVDENKVANIDLSALKIVRDIPNTPTAIATFTDGSDLPMPKLEVGIEAVQEGSGDPSPENIRPISGWDECNVTRTGKNLWNNNWSAYTQPSDYRICPIKLENGQYTASVKLKEGGTRQSGFTLGIAKQGDRYTNFGSFYTASTGADKTGTITVDDAWTAPKLIVYCSNESAFNAIFENYEIQLEEGSTATAYEPYNGHTYTTTLKDGQGNPLTCYGGQLSNENGLQRLTNNTNHVVPVAYRTGTASSGIAYVDCHLQGLTQDANAICDTYKQINMTDIAVDGAFRCYNNELTFYDNRFTDLTTANQILANVNVVYELATPLTIQLPTTVVKSLRGVNNISADSGDVRDGKYIADASLTIASLDARITALENQ